MDSQYGTIRAKGHPGSVRRRRARRPALTGRIAFELFCRTPNPARLSERERRSVERAAGFLAQARRHCLTIRTGRVTVFEFRTAPGVERLGTVLAIHGWGSRTEHMKTLIESFRDAGYRVVALDLPGHGASSGRRLTMLHALDAVRVAGEWFGPFARSSAIPSAGQSPSMRPPGRLEASLRLPPGGWC